MGFVRYDELTLCFSLILMNRSLTRNTYFILSVTVCTRLVIVLVMFS